MKKTVMKKLSVTAVLIGILCVGMLILQHPAKNGRRTVEYLPDIPDSPVYVECEENQPLVVKLKLKEDMDISGIPLLLVNVSEEDRGDLKITLADEDKNLLMDETFPLNSITPGEWMTVPVNATLHADYVYTVTVVANSGNPYFMQVSADGIKNLPFEETVFKNGETVEHKISMGIHQAVPVQLNYGDILYFSVPVLWIAFLTALLFVIFGKDRIFRMMKKIPLNSCFEKYGNTVFLLLLFIFSCLGIYSEGYMKNTLITADSAGYLREAVNLRAGNGFFCDGLAGYDSWFANWPILYPVLIAFVMLITGANAYLASKILSMIMVALILIVIRFFYKEDAWFYALCIFNTGFIALSQYTWSEVPFILLLLLFVLTFGKIVASETVSAKQYLLLGVLGLGCFLTRYFGIYIWMVTAVYICCFGISYLKTKEKAALSKALGFGITAGCSGVLSLLYLFVNKLKNGHASGVSRTLWWDDYEILTNDLIQSLLTEVANVFRMDIPKFVEAYSYPVKLLLVFIIIGLLAIFILKKCKWKSVEGVMITFGVFYYLIFIAIRYVSSMDTFYFRFFEPASFLICLGLMGLLFPYIKKKTGTRYFAVFMGLLLCLSMGNTVKNQNLKEEDAYYHDVVAQWEEDYREIPEKSVVIFSDLDYRSSYYRPDVVAGEIRPEESFSDICGKYYGSDYLCIKRDFAETMLESGAYESGMALKLEEALKELQDKEEYAIISLRF